MSETTIVDEWVTTTLSNDTGVASAFDTFPVAVFDALAPAATPYPFIVHQQQSNIDTNGIGPNSRIMVKVDLIARAVVRCDSFTNALLVALASAIDAALDSATGTTTGGVVLGCERQDEYRSIENEDGRQIRHLGGRYTVWVQQT